MRDNAHNYGWRINTEGHALLPAPENANMKFTLRGIIRSIVLDLRNNEKPSQNKNF